MIQLGQKVKDVITGFEGLTVGRAEYLTGCTQVLVVPQRLTAEGKRIDGEWFDEQRLQVTDETMLRLDPEANRLTPGCDREAPKR